MAQDITLLGASYSAVPAVVLPKTGGGSASFTDVTDTTAAAEDVASGKYFYTASGERTEGTASGGYTPDEFNRKQISGDIVLTDNVQTYRFSGMNLITGVIFNTGYDKGAGTNSFADCKAIKKVICINYPVWLGGWSFGGCTNLEYVINVFTVQGNALNGCSKLVAVDCSPSGSGESIGVSAFNNTKINTLVIRKTSGAFSLGNINAFNGTPFASNGTGGTLYVPSSLIGTYQTASNWSTILGYTNNQIKSIESTHTDPNAPIDLTLYYADGTPIPTT